MKVRVIKYSPELEEALLALRKAGTLEKDDTPALLDLYLKIAQTMALVSIARSLENTELRGVGPDEP